MITSSLGAEIGCGDSPTIIEHMTEVRNEFIRGGGSHNYLRNGKFNNIRLLHGVKTQINQSGNTV